MTRSLLQRFVPPLCLLLALGMLVVAFSLLAVGAPEPSIDLHQARASADETFLATWEADLVQRQRTRIGMIVALFVGSVLMAINAFRSMRA